LRHAANSLFLLRSIEFRFRGLQVKKLLVAGIAAAAFCGAPAFAADMPVKAPVNKAAAPHGPWTGCYIGANVGGGWGRAHWDDVTGGVPVGIGNPQYDGWIGGGQIGCDYQSGAWVVGVEGTLDAASLSGSTPNPLNALNIEQTRTTWLGLTTARLGYAVDRSLWYVKGGAAWTHDTRARPAVPFTFEGAGSQTSAGWTVGAGVEYMFAPQWSVKLEYDFIDLGSVNSTLTCRGVGCPFTIDLLNIHERTHIALVGLNYRFSTGAR
jgi:outer membrane immunogenic protein